MGYNSIRITCDTAGTSVKDFRIAGKFVNALSVDDTLKTTGFELSSNDTISFTDGTSVGVGTILVVFFET